MRYACHWFFLQRASLVPSYGDMCFFAVGYKHRCTNSGVFPAPEILEKLACPREGYVSWSPLEEKRPIGGVTHSHHSSVVLWKEISFPKFCFKFFKGMGVVLSNSGVRWASLSMWRWLQGEFSYSMLLLLVPDWNILFSFWVFVSLAPCLSSMTGLILSDFD